MNNQSSLIAALRAASPARQAGTNQGFSYFDPAPANASAQPPLRFTPSTAGAFNPQSFTTGPAAPPTGGVFGAAPAQRPSGGISGLLGKILRIAGAPGELPPVQEPASAPSGQMRQATQQDVENWKNRNNPSWVPHGTPNRDQRIAEMQAPPTPVLPWLTADRDTTW